MWREARNVLVLFEIRVSFSERTTRAPLKAFELEGASPFQGNVTALYPAIGFLKRQRCVSPFNQESKIGHNKLRIR